MPGIKRRVDASNDRDGKRAKVKDAAAPSAAKGSKKNNLPPAFQKKSVSQGSREFNKETKLAKAAHKKPSSKKVQKEAVDDDDEDDSEDSDSADDSDIDMDDEQDSIEEEQGDVYPEDEAAAELSGNGDHSNSTENKSSSRESHAKQRALAQERKAAKPNADIIARSKKLWERLRRKSHVPRDERKTLVAELYEIITGRVSDFVFKHDSVRVIQTALKYASPDQRKLIARELQGKFKDLAESRYAKFLLGKMLVHGDTEIRDLIVPEFYGHVKRLIKHPEASWILDDIYRAAASKQQRAQLLREWYGPEFAIFKDNTKSSEVSADLSQIIAENPEKKSPIMRHLYELINQLVQKKATGFTMLHDAMLQYFLNTKPGSSDASEFIEMIKGDEEGDLAKNMAFTQSGARLTCLCLAYSSAKDRKLLLRFYRDTIKLMAADVHAHMVILTAFEVVDDTRLTAKTIFPELLSQDAAESARNEELLMQVNDNNARIPLLYSFVGDKVKWLLPANDQEILQEVFNIRKETSKKEPSIRRQELVKAASPNLLEFIAACSEPLMETSFGCQFLLEVLFGAEGDKNAALSAVAAAAKSKAEAQDSPFVGRMLKSLVQGGRFNSAEGKIEKVNPPLGFHTVLYDSIKDDIVSWATGPQTFVVVALAESDDFGKKDELLSVLKKNKKALEKVAKASPETSSKQSKKTSPASSGAKLLLTKI
ncbi:Pumilio homology domain family member 6 [Talaromyces islandicus]|uniref:Pumilio homology domain family member 6 n=1 Tax=Talaromyces islandicus TaxID=28573 RepID=A0A0U1LRK7_TALIS|nr:Pumilio homology domain family member 6 [Talaromyces islandicus]